MNTVSIIIILALLMVIFVLVRAAVRFTDKHNKTVAALRRVKVEARENLHACYDLRRQLQEAQEEIEKWKGKAVAISLEAQKRGLRDDVRKVDEV